jgi:low temperature requirement protein LtrA
MFTTYGKSIVAAVYAVAVVAIPFLSGDRHVDPSEGVAIAIAVCTAILTYIAPLVPTARWVKTAVGAVLAGLQVLATVIIGGVDSNDVVLILAAIVAALGIAVAPAVSTPTGTRAGAGA